MTRDNQTEHETDPNDHADAYFLLDDGEARLGLCDCCGKHICTCDDWVRPGWYRQRLPSPTRTTDR